jgi:hypothetical protein
MNEYEVCRCAAPSPHPQSGPGRARISNLASTALAVVIWICVGLIAPNSALAQQQRPNILVILAR